MIPFLPKTARFGAGLALGVLTSGLWLLPGWVAPEHTQVLAHSEGAIAAEIQALRQTNQRWIQIDVARQRLIAWEGNTPVYAVIVSTGKSSSPTPTGVFAIQSMHRTARMQGETYDIPDVPYTMYYSGHYATHGTYWHRQFGTPVSQGCTNVAVNHAEWLFNWASIGVPVVVN